MSILAVRPSYQRKGLGSRLLAPVLELADNGFAKTYIEASEQGRGLYEKFGWVEVDEIVIDLSPYGGAKEEKMALMMREPGTMKRI
jgi:GNAT superfamily N-acetyltransferase